ncbi:MAG: enoyl-CoA hydratase/isomerase family protein [Rhodocyclaceae bacterium]|nr:MAG: enoyl-CoA hydratase/isomerase family protein [Rhodocyclaceae bacterium]
MSAAVTVARDGGIATVTLANDGKLNAVTAQMWRDLKAVFDGLSGDDSLRCVVVRGAGEAFAAGGDIGEFAALRDTLERARQYHEQWVAPALSAIRDCLHPTLAAIRGPCIGGGLEIACACDIRLAAGDARFGAPINKLGFSMAPAELEMVLAVAGPATALEILLEGRIIDAAEAHLRGLVGRVVDSDVFDEELAASVRRIAAGAPLVARAHKRMVRRLQQGVPLTEAELAASYDWLSSDDYREGLAAFAERRSPGFKGR